MKKRLFSIVMALCLVFSLTSCLDISDYGSEFDEDLTMNTPTEPVHSDWVLYWYLCGSNLETDGGCATTDLMEMMNVTLPENVRVVIQTGGAYSWQNNVMDSSVMQRFVYDSNGLSLVEEVPSASMGEASTLAEFLDFATTWYPADKTGVLFWNHGGGSVTGAAFDELYNFDSLTIDEMQEAFGQVFAYSEAQPPVELIGFDTCLMATIDVASAFSGFGHYLVASEEVEPGNGWEYSGWVQALADDPTMDGAALGRAICDTFYAGCEAVGTEESITLSVTDLTRIPVLVEAYDALGSEALNAACDDTTFFTRFSRAAGASENYGGNTREQGYTNMVDLGDLVRNASDLLPEHSDAVLSALSDCVLYQVNGPYRAAANGLSCYYSYNGDLNDLSGYSTVCAGDTFKYLYTYNLTGRLPADSQDFLEGTDYNDAPEYVTLPDMGWDNAPLTVDDEGCATLTLGEEADAILSSIGFQLYWIDAENDLMLLLGTDNDIVADWDEGVFKDNFRGVWGSIDGCLVYMELCYEGDDYNLYSVPILLNGEEYNLMVSYSFTEESWEILGARRSIDENGMADKELVLLQEGDEITTIHYLSSVSDEDAGFEAYTMDTITVTAETSFYETELADGEYGMIFEMLDSQNNAAYSDVVIFTVEDGEIYTTV